MALWTPALIDTALWLDADDAGTFTLAGSDIDQWADKSGNARHATPPGTKPTRTTGGINSKGSVVFGSGQDILQTPSFAPPAAADGLMVAMVFLRSASPVNYSIPICFGAVNAQWSTVIPKAVAPVPPGEWDSHVLRNTNSVGQFAISPMSTIASSTNYLLTGTIANAGIIQYLQGTELSGSVGEGTRNLGSSAVLSIGGAPAAGNQIEGQMAEIVVVHADITTDTRQKLEGYLAHKWGLDASLPGGHPYKSAAPTELTISGTTRDKTGALAARTVTAIRDLDQTVVGTITSDAVTGEFEIITPHDEAHTLIFSGEADRNAIVYSGVVPE